MWWLILHHFYRASIRKAWVHTLSTRGGEKNDAKLTAVCMRPPFRLRGQHGDRDRHGPGKIRIPRMGDETAPQKSGYSVRGEDVGPCVLIPGRMLDLDFYDNVCNISLFIVFPCRCRV